MANPLARRIDQAPATTAAVKAAIAPPGDETGRDLVFLGNKKVKANYTWRPHKNGKEEAKTSLFDFGSVTEEQLITLAMYACKVKVQAQLRDMANVDPTKPVPSNAFATVDVRKDIIEATSKADPVARAIQALRRAGASDAVVADALKGLRATK